MKRRQFLAAAGAGMGVAAMAQTGLGQNQGQDKRLQLFKCEECEAMVELIEPGHSPMTHCNKQMKLMPEQTEGELAPKHVPVIEKIPGGYKVKIGAVAHPMIESHHIVWIDLIADGKTQRAFLEIGKPAEAEFLTEAKNITVREHCNLHGVWKK